MKDRILQIMQSDGLSNVDFAKKIDISTSSLSHIFNGRNNPSLDVVKHIHSSYPSINLNWLLYGEGEMYDNNQQKQASTYSDNLSDSNDMNLFSNYENTDENTSNDTVAPNFCKENMPGIGYLRPKEIVKQEIKYIEKPHPQITEIRIFFDNGTYEVFKPEH